MASSLASCTCFIVRKCIGGNDTEERRIRLEKRGAGNCDCQYGCLFSFFFSCGVILFCPYKYYSVGGGIIVLLLVLDAGNTNTVIGIYEGERLLNHWRLMSVIRTADEIGIYLLNLLSVSSISPDLISGAIMSSVVPPLDSPLREGIRSYLGIECLKVSTEMDLGLEVRYASPHEVGADRLVNSVAGVARYGAPLIIVDFGTAITLDIISPDGAYLGGTIAPGLGAGMEVLFGKTAKLPKVSLEAPPSVIGNTTMASIQAGIMYGNAGLVDRLVEKTWEELGCHGKVVATGGQAQNIADLSRAIDLVDPWITLEGLRLIYLRNSACRG